MTPLHAKEGINSTGKSAHELNFNDCPELSKLLRNTNSNTTDPEVHEDLNRCNTVKRSLEMFKCCTLFFYIRLGDQGCFILQGNVYAYAYLYS